MGNDDQRKHIAAWCNGLSLAIFIAGFVTPFFVGVLDNDPSGTVANTFREFTPLETVIYGILVIGLAAGCHFSGHAVLMNMEGE